VTGIEILFAAFGLLAGAAAVLAVTSRHVVHAALWLVVTLGALAGVYLTLGAEIVALVQLLVYVGAVVVLVLFALMLTRAPIGLRNDLYAPRGQRLAASVAALATAALLGVVLLVAVGDATVEPDPALGRATPVGQALFAGWALPFELLSLLLLAALVGALVISKGPSRSRPAPRPGVSRSAPNGSPVTARARHRDPR
jgi:NADH-quinone oxidoreductase subunit J